MRTLIKLCLFALLASAAYGQTLGSVNGQCAKGGQALLTQNLPSTATQNLSLSEGTVTPSPGTGAIGSFPGCTVTVYLTGTTSPASIYSTITSTPLANPFTGNVDGSFLFFALPVGYDILLSGGGMPSPVTLTDVVPTIPATASAGLTLETNGTLNGSQTLLNLHQGTNVTIADNGSGTVTISASGGGGGGTATELDDCTTDETGFSFYNVASLTAYFDAEWTFCASSSTCTLYGGTAYINCKVYVGTAQSGATILLDIAANDGTAGHTTNFQTCDGVINSGTINIGSLTCASAQTFTTTSTAYNRVTLTFNVQSTLSNGSILIIKIIASTTGTAPSSNLLVYPHFIL